MKALKMGIIALVLGGGIAITQSSFRSAETDTLWGNNSGTFVNLTGIAEDNSDNPADGTYSCAESARVCTGTSATTPTQISDLSNQSPGTFSLN
ncbi:hypothetical protein SAMN05216464_1342 [Mucilaginibacter pineti]|uniref:Uncharacterized protein n=1 Tax=Mucilaginibacter pineti TaxID=1391627 RepID=A0A1G7P3J1_9SPHI|nr:hypothetical protein [Mucilaginibacter pineti]SDF80868.1 hypothetical protein SAMN05216464_1342 [Mucilaginibacter pineti]